MVSASTQYPQSFPSSLAAISDPILSAIYCRLSLLFRTPAAEVATSFCLRWRQAPLTHIPSHVATKLNNLGNRKGNSVSSGFGTKKLAIDSMRYREYS